jgi:hypothetical protein
VEDYLWRMVNMGVKHILQKMINENNLENIVILKIKEMTVRHP